ncbi:MAG: nucleotidyl transferase AbiEii/AbiGii toxin family protein [Chloroflexota bacterium]|nr:nucleotidyl transferase AbiEii/AbiGii toxin family protein [Chloroflexota bacterium]
MSAEGRTAYLALQRRARRERRPTQELFELYVLERFLYRLSISAYRGHFVLKGGLLLTALGTRRPTRDADVLARGLPNAEVVSVITQIVAIPVPDGVTFDASTVSTRTIRETAAYRGMRLSLPASLHQARLRLELDVRFGDPIRPKETPYPTLLEESPDFSLLAYPLESLLAEKIETMIARGDANTRVRDYADVLLLSQTHSVEARELAVSLATTAAYRGTELVPLSEVLGSLPATRQRAWEAFLDRTGLSDQLPADFEEAVSRVMHFVDPLIHGDTEMTRWNPSQGRWE